MLSGWQALVASRDDGSFQIAVPPGKGHLLVFGPTGDYVLAEIGRNTLDSDRPGGWRYRVHAIIPYEVKADDPPREVAAVLRPGVTIKGRVEGPDGQTVTDALRHHDAPRRGEPPLLARPVPGQGPRRPLRAPRPGPRGVHADLMSSTRSTSGARRSTSPASRPARI